MRRSYELHTFYSKDNTTHHVTLYKQPWSRYLIGKLYHWYDMNIEKIPGIKFIEGMINKRRLKKGWEQYLPIYANRDIRCYHLTRKDRHDIISFKVSEETYNKLRG